MAECETSLSFMICIKNSGIVSGRSALVTPKCSCFHSGYRCTCISALAMMVALTLHTPFRLCDILLCEAYDMIETCWQGLITHSMQISEDAFGDEWTD